VSISAATAASHDACTACLRHSWLLGELGAVLDRLSGDPGRLLGALELGEAQLLAALGGRRRGELEGRLAGLDPAALRPPTGIAAICRHHARYPRTLRGDSAPRVLFHTGPQGQLAALGAGPVVAILGGRRASDYGSELARGLARGLSASGVTVASTLRGAIAAGVRSGAAEVAARSIACAPAGLRAQRVAAGARGLADVCAVSELPSDCSGRRWGSIAAARVLAELCTVMVVVEAEDNARELACALLARDRGRRVVATPGRVTSPLSAGPHALVRSGAELVRGAADVLELLDHAAASKSAGPQEPGSGLRALLRETLERVRSGCETPEELCRGVHDRGAVLLALTELELMGLLFRDDAGRYQPCSRHLR
jgi:DNA processing protein